MALGGPALWGWMGILRPGAHHRDTHLLSALLPVFGCLTKALKVLELGLCEVPSGTLNNSLVGFLAAV